jgi:hypothetical protein
MIKIMQIGQLMGRMQRRFVTAILVYRGGLLLALHWITVRGAGVQMARGTNWPLGNSDMIDQGSFLSQRNLLTTSSDSSSCGPRLPHAALWSRQRPSLFFLMDFAWTELH